MEFEVYTAIHRPSELEKKGIAKFLHRTLEEYGDPVDQIESAIRYALQENNPFGGLIITIPEGNSYKGAVVINKTGMSGYIPENTLVYIAVDPQYRGQGIGKQLMQKTMSLCTGDIALHVEHDNPAKHLYEKLGFTNPYLEMRYRQ